MREKLLPLGLLQKASRFLNYTQHLCLFCMYEVMVVLPYVECNYNAKWVHRNIFQCKLHIVFLGVWKLYWYKKSYGSGKKCGSVSFVCTWWWGGEWDGKTEWAEMVIVVMLCLCVVVNQRRVSMETGTKETSLLFYYSQQHLKVFLLLLYPWCWRSQFLYCTNCAEIPSTPQKKAWSCGAELSGKHSGFIAGGLREIGGQKILQKNKSGSQKKRFC
jgi:hypothetical protein